MTMRLHRSRVTLLAGLLLAASAALVGIAVATSGSGSEAQAASGPIRLADATMIVEVNATDGDAGLQVFLDGEPWKSMTISDPDRRTILDVEAEGRLEGYGLTELFSES